MRRSVFLLFALTLLAALPAQADVWYSVHPLPQAQNLHDVAAVSADEAWAVGDNGAVVHLLNDRFTVQNVPGLPDLYAVLACSGSPALLVAGNKTIYAPSGFLYQAWRSTPDDVADLQGPDAEHLWLLDTEGDLYFLDGDDWKQVLSDQGEVTALAVYDEQTAFAACGSMGDLYQLNRSGSAVDEDHWGQLSYRVEGLAARDSDEVWVSGRAELWLVINSDWDQETALGTTLVSSWPYLAGSAADGVYVAGTYESLPGIYDVAVFHWNGSSLEELGQQGKGIRNVTGLALGDHFLHVAGQTELFGYWNEEIRAYDVGTVTRTDLTDLVVHEGRRAYFTGSRLVASSSSIYESDFCFFEKHDNTLLATLDFAVVDLVDSASSVIWGVGCCASGIDGYVFRYGDSGLDTWEDPIYPYVPTAVWTVDGEDVWITGTLLVEGATYKGDGADWVKKDEYTGRINAFWGTPGGKIWGAGIGGVRYFNEDSWRWEEVPYNTLDLYAIHGLDADHIWAVGQSGTILSRNGDEEKWERQESHTSADLRAVAAVSPSEVYAGGDHGVLLRYDGEDWSDLDLPADVDGIYALAFSPEGDLWAAADNGRLFVRPAADRLPDLSLALLQGSCRPGDHLKLDFTLAAGGFDLDVTLCVAVEVGGAFYFLSAEPSYPSFSTVPSAFSFPVAAGDFFDGTLLDVEIGASPPAVSGTIYGCLFLNGGVDLLDYTAVPFEIGP